jgi:hypothetical protein
MASAPKIFPFPGKIAHPAPNSFMDGQIDPAPSVCVLRIFAPLGTAARHLATPFLSRGRGGVPLFHKERLR